MPASTAQIAANRRNAHSSTGPRTPAGKARSSQNARTHSLTACFVPILERDRARFDALAAELREFHQPAGPIEHDYVEQIIVARLHMLQVERVFAGYWDIAETPELAAPKRQTERHRCRALAATIIKDSDGKNAFGKILRYQSAARRAMKQAQEALEHHRATAYEECETNPIPELSNEELMSLLPKGFASMPWSEREARIKALEHPPGPPSRKLPRNVTAAPQASQAPATANAPSA